MRPLAEEKQISLQCEPCNQSLAVACSPGVLVSMLLNFIGNAIKYMGEAPLREVSVRVSDLGRLVRVTVEDTGPGIPPALHSRLFVPHVRGAEARFLASAWGSRPFDDSPKGTREASEWSQIRPAGAASGSSFPSGRSRRARRLEAPTTIRDESEVGVDDGHESCASPSRVARPSTSPPGSAVRGGLAVDSNGVYVTRTARSSYMLAPGTSRTQHAAEDTYLWARRGSSANRQRCP